MNRNFASPRRSFRFVALMHAWRFVPIFQCRSGVERSTVSLGFAAIGAALLAVWAFGSARPASVPK